MALVEQPYRVAGRRSPAPAAQLDKAWTSVVEQLRRRRSDRLPAAHRRTLLRCARPRAAPRQRRAPSACSVSPSLCGRRGGLRAEPAPRARRRRGADARRPGERDPFGIPPPRPRGRRFGARSLGRAGSARPGCRRAPDCANICSCHARRRSSTPTWTRSSRPSSSVTSAAPRPARDRRRRRRPRGELRGEGVRHPHGDGERRPALCPDAVVVEPRISAYVEASKAVFEVFDTTRRSSRGCRSTRRSSTCGAWSGADAGRDRRAASPGRRDRRRAADHGRRREDEVPRQGRERRGEAGRPPRRAARTASSRSPPAPVERLWGVGPVTAAKLHARGSRRCGRSRSWRSGPRLDARAASGRHLHALAHNRDPRPVRTGRRRARSARSGRSAARRARPSRSTRSLVGLVDRVTRRMRGADRVGRTVVLRLASTTSRGRRGRTRCRQPTAQTTRSLLTGAGLLAAAMPPIEDRASRSSASRVANLDNDRAMQLQLPFDRTATGTSTPRSTRFARGSARPPSRARCCSDATRLRCRCSRTERIRVTAEARVGGR